MAFLSMALGFIVFGWTVYHKEQELSVVGAQKLASLVMNNFATASSPSIETDDLGTLHSLMAQTANFDQVLDITVTDNQGRVLAHVTHNHGLQPEFVKDSSIIPIPGTNNNPVSLQQNGTLILWHAIADQGWVIMKFDTRAQVSAISAGASFALSINGQTLTGSTPDALAASINANGILQQAGIIATSNGSALSVRSVQGADLAFTLAGGAGNALQVTGSSGAAQTLNGSGSATVGGVVNLQLPGNSSVTTTGAGLFTTSPSPASVYQGYTLALSGVPVAGDTFTVNYNSQGSGDARNGQAMLALQSAALADQGQMSMDGLYGAMVQSVGTQTAQTQNSQSAAAAVLQNTTQLVTQVSGVNINEEAVNLIQYQQAYSASAQVINTARTLFNSLLTAVGA